MPVHQSSNMSEQDGSLADISMPLSRTPEQEGKVLDNSVRTPGNNEQERKASGSLMSLPITHEQEGRVLDSSMPLPRTHDVLCEHVHAVVTSLIEPDEDAQGITRLVAMGTEKELLQLLTNPNLMQERVGRARALIERGAAGALSSPQVAKKLSHHQELVGKALFEKVAEIESELSAQVTGMLLELPLTELERLLDSNEELQAAVVKARIEYLAERHPDMLPSPEQLGQEIYEAVMLEYPEEAAKIAGMILELNPTKLHQLLECRDELSARIEQAHQTLLQHR